MCLQGSLGSQEAEGSLGSRFLFLKVDVWSRRSAKLAGGDTNQQGLRLGLQRVIRMVLGTEEQF